VGSAQRLLVDLELLGVIGLGDAESRGVLNESALVSGRHIFGGHFPLRIAFDYGGCRCQAFALTGDAREAYQP
jgi:hypothetical protein